MAPTSVRFTRRTFLAGTAATASLTAGGGLSAILAARQGPALAASDKMRPQVPFGVQAGDIMSDGGMLWSATDRPARMLIECATRSDFSDVRRIQGPDVLAATSYTGKFDLRGLPAGQEIFYRVCFQDLGDLKTLSAPVEGRFRTAPSGLTDVSFVWGGDVNGQGWGINEDWGGMKIFDAMLADRPDFFIHSGDSIYADGPIEAEKEMPQGGVWKSLTIEEKSKVAETLDEFRGNYRYNLMDRPYRSFLAETPMLAQWDDHETVNNWYPGEQLEEDDRYHVKSASLLAARAKHAFLEWMPVRPLGDDGQRIHRSFSYGPLVDVFMLDMRSFRAANSGNRQPTQGSDTVFMGSDQIRWIKQELLHSQATWKVIASDMPLGLVVGDGDNFENLANGNGPVLGREHELADLLRFIKNNNVQNVVWFTADVHYAAAHYYDPNRARFSDFKPFWEFVSGPLNAGTFGPNALDDTFGPQVVFQKAPAEGRSNLPPAEGLQFYGQVNVDANSKAMTVKLKDLEGQTIFTREIAPEQA